MNRVALLLLVAFGMGGAIGFVAGAGSDTDPVLEPTGGAEPSAPRVERRGGDRGLAPIPESTSRSLAGAIDSLPGPSDIPTGDGAITGTVKTANGEPLAGALVRATPRRDSSSPFSPGFRYPFGHPRGDAPPPDEDLDVLVRRYLDQVLWSREARRDGTSDAEGHYTIQGISDREYGLSAWKEGYRLHRSPGGWVKAGDTADFTARPVLQLPVSVLLPDGTAPEKANVRWEKGGSNRNVSWSPEDPEIDLDPGTYLVRATGGEENGLASKKVTVKVEEGVPPEEIVLKLEDRPGIRGKVVFPEGENSGSAQISLLFVPAGGSRDPKRLLQEGRRSWVHGNRASYSFPDLAPGTYLLGLVANNNQRVIAHTTVEVADGMVEQDLELPSADPADYVEVVVQGPDGSTLGDVSIQAGIRSSRYRGSGQTRTRKLEDGVWQVHHYAMSGSTGAENVTRYLRVTSPEYGTKEVEYDADATGRLTIRFDEPATLVVRIAGYVGSGYEGRLGLSVTEDRESARHSYYNPYGRSSLDSEGTQTIGPIPPGPKVVRLVLQSGPGRSCEIQRAEVVVKPGENRHAIGLPHLYELTVVTDALDPESQISIRPKENQGMWGAPGQKATNGRVVFTDLPAGEYMLYAYGKQYGQMDVTVPGSGAVRFVPKEVNAFLVRIRDADGAMAKAGLVDGDHVVAVDGEEIKSRQQGYALLSLARAREKSKLTVVRGGRSLELSVAVSEIWRNGDGGGSLEPVTR